MQAGTTGKGLFGGAERLQEQMNAPKKGNQLGKDAFLKLLVTQMENQDPLNPIADTDFIAQLSQYSSLEQLINIAKGVEGLNKQADKNILNSASFIGKTVLAHGDSISKYGDTISRVGYTLKENCNKAVANIFDSNNNIIRSVELPAQQAGSYYFDWDGKNSQGQDMPSGVYKISIGATDKNDRPIMVDMQVAGIVNGVLTENGATMLKLADGRKIKADQVTEIGMPRPQKPPTNNSGTGGGTSSTGGNGTGSTP